MKISAYLSLSLLAFASSASSQALIQAISGYAELSNFTALLTANPNLANALLTTNTSSLIEPATVLIPNNNAFAKFASENNISISAISIQQLEPILLYHLLVGQVTTGNLSDAAGITVPTFLNTPQYNNRTGGPGLGSNGSSSDPNNGQVVFLQAQQDGSAASRRFKVRQLQNPTYNVTSGVGETINLTAVDGRWAGGYFQIVDSFLTLPLNCTTTFARFALTSFLRGLEVTNLGPQVDITQNLTCLTPTDDAFLSAGSPENNTNLEEVSQLILLHTITVPIYSSFLEDGMTFTTFSNETVRVSVDENGVIMINDAIVISTDVITNNGLMYVLDRVMSPLTDQSSATGSATLLSPSATSTGGSGSGSGTTATVSVTATVTAAAAPGAVPFTMGGGGWGSGLSWLWSLLVMLL